jgi:ribosomal protein S18 acetylase RimI-like enzyme
MSIKIKVFKQEDLHILQNVAPDIFDDALNLERTKEFLNDARHHLIVALEGDTVVGFISAVHYVHPDKAEPELWINEVSVAETHQQRGLGKRMMQAIFEVGHQLGCKEAWVLTERSNTAAMKLYGSSGGVEGAPDGVMFTFFLEDSSQN